MKLSANIFLTLTNFLLTFLVMLLTVTNVSANNSEENPVIPGNGTPQRSQGSGTR